MTAAGATPQQMRDRLLQAVDNQSNIHNMVAVLEVITALEKYPITKEALEVTRLGKLINDVRKKTKDEDLAKRAKKLLKNWQKLIEPAQNEPLGANDGQYRPDATAPAVILASGELKSRSNFKNCYSPNVEMPTHRKHKGELRDGLLLASKVSKMPYYDQETPPTNGRSLDTFPDIFNNSSYPLDSADYLDHDRPSKIPINAVRPHPSSPALAKLPNNSSHLKTTMLQQLPKQDFVLSTKGLHHTKSPHSSFQSLRIKSHELSSSSEENEPISSPPKFLSSLDRSSLMCQQSVSPPVRGLYTLTEADLSTQCSNGILGSRCDTLTLLTALKSLPGHTALSEGSKTDSDISVSRMDRKRKKYRPRDYTVSLVGSATEDHTKPIKLKGRRLTFDPMTGQIKPFMQKEPQHRDELPGLTLEPKITEKELQQNPGPSPFQQTNWKELSRNEIIQSYLDRQSNVLTSCGARMPGAHFFMSEYLKNEDQHIRETRKMHILLPDIPVMDRPGVTREVTPGDLHRIHSEHWAGVNGCYDTKDNWYDWTQPILLDPHGDEHGQLVILPYVCLD
ncbi:mediator of RNA polymerase II transcription subunit 26-like isoform X2 [Denticeps clupeoides]|uniref:Mediator of RNA polymerase II transcription subunit 26 n=1 Tax=Denticeps clupeoides TaxID=299321 RepID=A0AAY4D8C4_9TELE|nr:mediator of RNA polymerase II transcription subunit 26-like isoform X2 [Denticeps clupeoides]